MPSQPHTRGKEYAPLQLIFNEEKRNINKCAVVFEAGKLVVDGREVNSFFVDNQGNVFITGQHYTSQEKANEIRTLRQFIPGEEDAYIYFLEEGFHNLSPKDIRHISGAASVERKFTVTFVVPAERVWIKVERDHPVKFAIQDGLASEEIREILIDRI